jgi:hypothetical protein
MLVKTNVSGFVKNTDNGLIINNNEDQYKKIVAARAQAKKNNELTRRVEILEKEIKELKALLLNGNK